MVLQRAGHGLPLLQAKNLWVYIRSSLWMQGETWKRNLKVRTIFNAMSIFNSNLLGSSFWWGRILGHGYFCLFICCLFCCLFFMNYQLQSLLSLHSRLPIYKLWVSTPLWQSPAIRSSVTQVSSDSSNNLLVPQCDALSILWMQYVMYLIDSSGQWNHNLQILRASVEIYIIDPLGKTLSTLVKIKQNKCVANTINITFHTSNYVNSFY
jgi:hypothetical protein